MKLRLAFALLLSVFLVSLGQVSAQTAAPAAPQTQQSKAAPANEVDLGAAGTVLDLKPFLKAYHPPQGGKADSANWFTFTATNSTGTTATRVLQAGQPPSTGLSVLPHPVRPQILQVVSPNPGVVVESTNAYGRKSYLITIPAKARAGVAIRLAGGSQSPSLLAWTEQAIAQHKNQTAIFIAAVAGLIGAAAAICFGLAVMTHHWAPRWAAASLTALLLARLSAVGLFDGSIVTTIGGPYGLTALFGALSLAAGIRFVDLTVPLREVFPVLDRNVKYGLYGIIGVGALAYIGLPLATLLTDIILFAVPPAIFAYLIYRQKLGSAPARIVQPAAGLFAMVSLISGFAALGGFRGALVVPDLAGGFAAAGAILLSLAVTAGEGIAVIPWRHGAHFPQPPQPRPAPPPPPQIVTVPDPDTQAALEAIGASRQGVFELDLASEEAILSAEAALLLGMEAGRIPHQAFIGRVHQDDRPVYEQAIGEFRRQSGLAFRIEFRVLGENGRYPWCELRATMKGPDGAPAERCVGLLADVTTRKDAEADMIDRSVRDPLTGLGNRVALLEELEGLGARLRNVVFAVLDIDRFKSIHASLGDEGGDAVLIEVSQRLYTHFSGFADVFRVGGDSFAVLFRNTAEKPEMIGSSLVQLCEAAYRFQGRSIFAPASVGVALGREARDPIDLIKNAELALVQAKRQGGGCSRLYAPAMDASAPPDKVALDTELRHGLERGEIEVFYQPIVRLADRTIAGFEALLRWRHPAKGLVSPSEFIAHCEQTGIIVELGAFALNRAAAELAEWQRYFPLQEPLFVSVNLSRRQLREGDKILSTLASLLQNEGLARGTLKLEVTESAIAADDNIKAFADQVRALGAGLAIDDFGTGLSSLSQLAELPFDTLKIDKSFLSRESGEKGGVVLGSIVSMARELGRSVIVEGVETEADAGRLAALGCEFAQGFLFSEAVSAQDAITFIARTFRHEDAAELRPQ